MSTRNHKDWQHQVDKKKKRKVSEMSQSNQYGKKKQNITENHNSDFVSHS